MYQRPAATKSGPAGYLKAAKDARCQQSNHADPLRAGPPEIHDPLLAGRGTNTCPELPKNNEQGKHANLQHDESKRALV